LEEGVAASTSNDVQQQLRALYGQEVRSAVQVSTGRQGVIVLASAFGKGKVFKATATLAAELARSVSRRI
jgi:hypothetical protein